MSIKDGRLSIDRNCTRIMISSSKCPGSMLWWTGRDLNPRPPECKSGVHARLNYRPAWNHEGACQTKLFLLTYGNIKGKRGKREGRTILEDYSIYIFNVNKRIEPKQRYQMSPRLLKINVVLQSHKNSSLKKLYRPQNPYKIDAQVGEHAWTG